MLKACFQAVTQLCMLCQLHDGHLLFGPFILIIWNLDRCRLEELQCSSTAPPQGDAALVRPQGASPITRQPSCRLRGNTLLLDACVPDTGQHRLLHLLFIVYEHVVYCHAEAQTFLQGQQALSPVSALHSPVLPCLCFVLSLHSVLLDLVSCYHVLCLPPFA
jgi:hypothetical protein